jgi:hypothetical protein
VLRIRTVTPKSGYEVELTLTDGSIRRVDLLPYLRGPVFDPIREDPELFRRISVDEELGTVVWPNGADIDPDVLIHGRRPAAWPVMVARDGSEGSDPDS